MRTLAIIFCLVGSLLQTNALAQATRSCEQLVIARDTYNVQGKPDIAKAYEEEIKACRCEGDQSSVNMMLGKPSTYWRELETSHKSLHERVDGLIQELAELEQQCEMSVKEMTRERDAAQADVQNWIDQVAIAVNEAKSAASTEIRSLTEELSEATNENIDLKREKNKLTSLLSKSFVTEIKTLVGDAPCLQVDVQVAGELQSIDIDISHTENIKRNDHEIKEYFRKNYDVEIKINGIANLEYCSVNIDGWILILDKTGKPLFTETPPTSIDLLLDTTDCSNAIGVITTNPTFRNWLEDRSSEQIVVWGRTSSGRKAHCIGVADGDPLVEAPPSRPRVALIVTRAKDDT